MLPPMNQVVGHQQTDAGIWSGPNGKRSSRAIPLSANFNNEMIPHRDRCIPCNRIRITEHMGVSLGVDVIWPTLGCARQEDDATSRLQNTFNPHFMILSQQLFMKLHRVYMHSPAFHDATVRSRHCQPTIFSRKFDSNFSQSTSTDLLPVNDTTRL